MKETKTVAVLGATGSVGTQALDVAAARGYRVDFLSANRQLAQAETLARRFHPRFFAMADPAAAAALRVALADTDITVLSGEEGILAGIAQTEADTVIHAILGEAGLRPTLAVIDTGRRLALANKESLVIAGRTVMQRLRERGGELLPVDSEHSAIFQSLQAGHPAEVRRLLLTASGGPFFGRRREELARVTVADTLAHPTWRMGAKITVDSATLMNKGFEVIEASHLFGVPASRIEVLVHRESILHSAVEYIDGTVIGELSVPDMRMCVQYAVDYPHREPGPARPLDLFSVGALTFQRPDTDAFPLLALAQRAMADGGAMGAVVNAADEVAVAAFLAGEIGFTDIADTVERVYGRMADAATVEDLDGILQVDQTARRLAAECLRD